MAGHTNSDGNEAANTIDRRQFVASLTTAGAVATIGGMAPAAESARRNEQAVAAQPSAAADFPRPANLQPGAQLDSRFPVSFAETVAKRAAAGHGVFHRAQSARSSGALAHAALPVRHLRRHRADRRPERRGFRGEPAAVAQCDRQGEDTHQDGLVRSAREHQRAPLLSGRRRLLAVVHALHARRPQAARVRRHLFGDQQRRALGHPAGVDDRARGGLPRRELSRCRSGGHSRQPELSGRVRLRQREGPQRSALDARVVRTPATGGHARGQRQLRLRAARALA